MTHSDTRKELIDFLVYRKTKSLVPGTTLHLAARSALKTSLVHHQAIERYRSELQGLSDDQLRAVYDPELSKACAEAQQEEESRFFNKPHAAADFDHWSKAEHWSLEEAVALAMGKATEVVNWPKIQSYGQASPFVQKYGRLRDLAQRAVPWKNFTIPFSQPSFSNGPRITRSRFLPTFAKGFSN
jgi:hypothetical protein